MINGNIRPDLPNKDYWLYGIRIWAAYGIKTRTLYEFRGLDTEKNIYVFKVRGSSSRVYVGIHHLTAGLVVPFLYNMSRFDESNPVTSQEKPIKEPTHAFA